MNTESQDRQAVDVALLVVRVTVGIIFAAHGAQKLFGAFGGPGLRRWSNRSPTAWGRSAILPTTAHFSL